MTTPLAARWINTTDYHTAGEPFRIVHEGLPELPGTTVGERRVAAIADVGGVDTLAHGLLIAAKMVEDDKLGQFKAARYAGWDQGMGKQILDKELDLAAIADLASSKNIEPTPRSGRQEMLETIVSRYA